MEDTAASRELKRRHITHARLKILDFSPNIGKYSLDYLKNNFNDVFSYETKNINTIEGVLESIFTQDNLDNKDLFSSIATSISKGSKSYASEARNNMMKGANWKLFLEYNRIHSEINKLL